MVDSWRVLERFSNTTEVIYCFFFFEGTLEDTAQEEFNCFYNFSFKKVSNAKFVHDS